jgi:hypothetical protein
MQYHHLHDIESLALAGIEIFLRIASAALAEEQPSGVAQPEKWLAVFRPEISAILADPESLQRLRRRTKGCNDKYKYKDAGYHKDVLT